MNGLQSFHADEMGNIRPGNEELLLSTDSPQRPARIDDLFPELGPLFPWGKKALPFSLPFVHQENGDIVSFIIEKSGQNRLRIVVRHTEREERCLQAIQQLRNETMLYWTDSKRIGLSQTTAIALGEAEKVHANDIEELVTVFGRENSERWMPAFLACVEALLLSKDLGGEVRALLKEFVATIPRYGRHSYHSALTWIRELLRTRGWDWNDTTGEAQPAPARHFLPQHINWLVVDDNPVFAALVGSLLEEDLGPPEFAFDGNELMEQVLRQSFSLIVSDLHMPRADGLTAAHWVRAWEKKQNTSRCPILILTGANAEECQSIRTTGVVDEVFAKDKVVSIREKILELLTPSSPQVKSGTHAVNSRQ